MLKKFDDLEVYSRKAIKNFPRYEKYVLSTDIRRQLLKIRANIICAMKKYTKKTTLRDLDIDIEILRSYIRISYTMGYINEHKLGHWMEGCNLIGRIVGKWLANQK